MAPPIVTAIEQHLHAVQAGPCRQERGPEREGRTQPPVHHADLASQLGVALLGRGHEDDRALVESESRAGRDDLARDQEVVGAGGFLRGVGAGDGDEF